MELAPLVSTWHLLSRGISDDGGGRADPGAILCSNNPSSEQLNPSSVSSFNISEQTTRVFLLMRRSQQNRLMLTETVSTRDGFFCFICEIYF